MFGLSPQNSYSSTQSYCLIIKLFFQMFKYVSRNFDSRIVNDSNHFSLILMENITKAKKKFIFDTSLCVCFTKSFHVG